MLISLIFAGLLVIILIEGGRIDLLEYRVAQLERAILPVTMGMQAMPAANDEAERPS